MLRKTPSGVADVEGRGSLPHSGHGRPLGIRRPRFLGPGTCMRQVGLVKHSGSGGIPICDRLGCSGDAAQAPRAALLRPR
jgi:hypothetical protein